MTQQESPERPFVRSDVAAFLDMLAANPRPKMSRETIAAMRPMAPQGMAMLEPPVGDLVIAQDFTMPSAAGDIPARLFDHRDDRPTGPLLIFFHGGGYVIGCIDTHLSMCAELSRQLDLPVVSVEYRLAPEHPWPAAVDDAEAAARWLADQGTLFGRSFDSLVIAGDSAGGNLTLVTTLALRDRAGALPVIFQIALYPAVDVLGDYPSGALFGEGYGLDATDMAFYNAALKPHPTHWRARPIAATVEDLPSTLIVAAGLDPLRDQGRAYAAKLVMGGVSTAYIEVAGTIHGFLGFRRAIPSARKDFEDILATARTMLANARSRLVCEGASKPSDG